jgi:Fic family protein
LKTSIFSTTFAQNNVFMSLISILSEIDSLKTALDSCYPIPLDRLQKINYKFRLDWNYHSNKMEGGTLSFEETRSVMMEQLEIHGKPLRDVMEMRGHDEVIKNIQKLGQGDLRLTENRIKDIHKAIIFGEDDLPGRFKNRDNYIYNYAGERFDFTPKEDTAAALNTLTNWLNNALNAVKKGKNREKRTIPDIAFEYHLRFLTIHPFLDGNGRTGRILLNLILISNGYPPIIIRSEEKDIYGKHIAHAQQYEENPQPLYEMLGNLLMRSLQTCLKGARGENLFELEDWEKRLQFLETPLADRPTKTAENVYAVLQNSFLPLLTYSELKLAAFDTLFSKKTRTIHFDDAPILDGEDVQKKIETLKNSQKIGSLNSVTIFYDWQDFKKSSEVENTSILLKINFLDDEFSIDFNAPFASSSIRKKYNESLTYEDIQNFVNNLGSRLMDNIEHQMG